jgi:tetratricopeptide (TPR) repeat protein
MRCMMVVMLFFELASLSSVQAQNPNSQAMRQAMLAHPEMFVSRVSDPVQEQQPTPSAGGTVSVEDLKVPEKAKKELERSDKAMHAGDMPGAIEHLQKALAIDPEIPQAHNGLGAFYAAEKEYDKAVAEFEKALEMRKDYHLAADNMALVLCIQHRFSEAEPVARRALDIQPEALTSEYLLGGILVDEGRFAGEGPRLLEKTKERYPRSWLFLAKAAAGRGEYEEAAEDLRTYLKLPGAEKKPAEEWLMGLEKVSGKGKEVAASGQEPAGSNP